MRRGSGYLWELRPYFRQVRGQLLLGSIGGFASNLAIVLPAVLLGRAVDAVLALDQGRSSSGAVTRAAALFVAGTVAHEVTKMVKRWCLNTAWAAMKANIRADALRGVLSWPLERLEQTPEGEVLARVVGDVEVLGDGFGEVVFESWDTALMTLSLAVAMSVYDWRLAALALLPVPLALAVGALAGRAVARRTGETREAAATVTTAIQEYLAAMRVLRLHGQVDWAIGEVGARSRGQADAGVDATRLREGLKPLYATLVTAGVALLVWRGGEAVIAGSLSVGALVAFLQLYLRFVGRAPGLPEMLNNIRAGGAAWERLRPLLAPPAPTADAERWASFRWGRLADHRLTLTDRGTGDPGPVGVSLDNVSYSYPGASRPALADVSLDVPPGALMLVTGSVGSGKTALARLLAGLHAPEAGTISLDEARGRTGYLPQAVRLFSGSVAENVAMAWPTQPEDPDVVVALRLAALDAELAALPAGSRDGEGQLGTQVSGGQRQRVGLARAVAATHPLRPRMIVLDDPFSSVDLATQGVILAGLVDAFGPQAPPERRATVVVCSSRVVGVAAFDLVVGLDRGRVVEQGALADVLAAGGLCARMLRAQSESGQ